LFSRLHRYWESLRSRQVPGFHHDRAKGDKPTIRDRRHPSSPCPPLDRGVRILTLRLNYVGGYTDPSSSSLNGPTTTTWTTRSLCPGCSLVVPGGLPESEVTRFIGPLQIVSPRAPDKMLHACALATIVSSCTAFTHSLHFDLTGTRRVTRASAFRMTSGNQDSCEMHNQTIVDMLVITLHEPQCSLKYACIFVYMCVWVCMCVCAYIC